MDVWGANLSLVAILWTSIYDKTKFIRLDGHLIFGFSQFCACLILAYVLSLLCGRLYNNYIGLPL